METLPKILVIGDAGWGKDTVGELMEGYGFKFLASSTFATDRIMMPYFESLGKPYPTSEECFDDRVNNRALWYDQIEAYNAPTWNRVTREMFEAGYNVYVGMRSEKEFPASKDLYDHIIWVDASKRLPSEDVSSNTMTPDMADYILDNNGTLEELKYHVGALTNLLILHKQLQGTPDRNTDVLIGRMFVGENSDFNLDHRTLRNRKMPCPEFTRSTDAIFKWLIPDNCSLSMRQLVSGGGIASITNHIETTNTKSVCKTPALAGLNVIVSYYLSEYHSNFKGVRIGQYV